MYRLLNNVRVVEAASFIAGPSCGLHLAQLGADVIRIDPIGGAADRHRFPRLPDGTSLYWEGLNKGKRSVVLNLSRPEGRELAQRLVAAPGENAGLFITNSPATGVFSHEALAALRPDVITLRIMGWRDGATAVDYTVNAAIGVPLMTGVPEVGEEPVNSVLPAWDLLTGAYGAFAMLAAERSRRDSGHGTEIRLPLGDVAAGTLAHLGQLAEVLLSGADRPRYGNDLFGAFGRDFATADGKRVMVVAITGRQWADLVASLRVEAEIASIESDLDVSFGRDEGLRFLHRERLWPVFEAAFGSRTLDELVRLFERTGVCWAPYRSVLEAATSEDRFGFAASRMSHITHPSGSTYPTPGAAAQFSSADRLSASPAPHLGEHTDEVLAGVLGLPDGEIARLHDAGLVG